MLVRNRISIAVCFSVVMEPREGHSTDTCPSWVELPAAVWQTILLDVSVSNALMKEDDGSLKRAGGDPDQHLDSGSLSHFLHHCGIIGDFFFRFVSISYTINGRFLRHLVN